MTTHDDERDLRARFRALRAADAELAPGYDSLRAGPRELRRARPGRFLALAALAAAAGLALWLAAPEHPALRETPARPARLALGQWWMPSDALLDLSDLPGDTLLRDPPPLGSGRAPGARAPAGASAPTPAHRRSLA